MEEIPLFPEQAAKQKQLAMKLYNYCISQPEIPDVDMSFRMQCNCLCRWQQPENKGDYI